MKYSFFKAFAAVLCGSLRPGAGAPPPDLGALHRRLKRNKSLQALAQEHGDRLRLEQWLVSVQDGYRHKQNLVAMRKGRNTLAGIPA